MPKKSKVSSSSTTKKGRAARDREALERARLLLPEMGKGLQEDASHTQEENPPTEKIDYGYEFNWTDLGRPPIVRREFSEETVEYLGHPDLVELAQRERDFQPIGEELRRRLMRLPAQELEKAGKIGLEHIKRPGKERM